MRKQSGHALLLIALAALPSLAEAQRRPATQQRSTGARHELGVDLGAGYQKPSGVPGGIVMGTPLALRLGLVTAKKVMWEPRLALEVNTVGGSTDYIIQPGVNVLYAMAPGTHRRGMYLTGGGALDLIDVLGTSGTVLSMNAAIGWRKPWGNAAWRYEVGFGYSFENQSLGQPSTIELGGRIGLSLWH
jgi:hypothetical protein